MNAIINFFLHTREEGLDFCKIYVHLKIYFPGANVWSVDPFFAEAGYVLGWQPDKETPLDVGYYQTSLSFEELRSVYEYKEVYDVQVGNVFSYNYEYTELYDIMHMVRAYAFVSTVFAETFTGKVLFGFYVFVSV